MKREVIIVTDGDKCAKSTIEAATKKVGGRCISMAVSNYNKMEGEDIISLVKMAKYDPVIVMVDDRGNNGFGDGEKIMEFLFNNNDIRVIGVIAVASNTRKSRGVRVDYSIDKYGDIVNKAVNKYGKVKKNNILIGDTVNSLADYEVPVIVGIGDPGKMDGFDDISVGSPILTKALQCIIDNNIKNKPF